MARYNCERLSNRMERVKPFSNLRETISEAYYPKMSSLITSRAWPARSPNAQLTDLNRTLDEIKITITDMETFIDRFKQAVEEGYAKDVSLSIGKQSIVLSVFFFKFFYFTFSA